MTIEIKGNPGHIWMANSSVILHDAILEESSIGPGLALRCAGGSSANGNLVTVEIDEAMIRKAARVLEHLDAARAAARETPP